MSSDYSDSISRGFDKAVRIAKEEKRGEARFKALASRSRETCWLFVRNESSSHALAAINLLIDEAFSYRFSDKEKYLEQSRLCVELAEFVLHREPTSSVRVHENYSRALMFAGNAYRCMNRFSEAIEVFKESKKYLDKSFNRFSPLNATYWSFLGSYYRSQASFTLASSCFENEHKIWKVIGNPEKESAALHNAAVVHMDSGNPGEAIRLLEAAWSDLSEVNAFWALHALTHMLAKEGLHDLAEQGLDFLRAHQGNDWFSRALEDQIRGTICNSRGEYKDARVLLESAQDSFVERDMYWDAATIGLELIIADIGLGDFSEAATEASILYRWLKASGVSNDAEVSLILLRKAIAAQAATAAMVYRAKEAIENIPPGLRAKLSFS